jgi:hypothetical protein
VRLFRNLARQSSETKEKELQEAWSSLQLPKQIENVSVSLRMHDTHTQPFLDGRKPDLTLTSPELLPTPFSAVVLAELTVDDFSPSKQGELLSCVHRALEIQVFRHFMFSFLCGRAQILFFRTTVTHRDAASGCIHVQHHSYGALELDGPVASQCLGGLFTASLADLGWRPPRIHVPQPPVLVDAVDLLGSGLTSNVYKVQVAGQSLAAKLFCHRDGFDVIAACEHECQVYRSLEAASVQHVLRQHGIGWVDDVQHVAPVAAAPSLAPIAEVAASASTALPLSTASAPAAVPRRAPVLMLSPVCVRLRSSLADPTQQTLQGYHCSHLIDAVAAIHRAGYLHRDIRPENIGWHQDQLYLLDVGFAVRIDAPPSLWQGTVRYASPRVLQHLAGIRSDSGPFELKATVTDDLHSLLRCWYAMLFPHLVMELKQWDTQRAAALADFWQRRLNSGVWRDLSRAIDHLPSVDAQGYEAERSALEDRLHSCLTNLL